MFCNTDGFRASAGIVGEPVVTDGMSVLKLLIKSLTLFTISLELFPEYHPPSPIIPHLAAFLISLAIGELIYFQDSVPVLILYHNSATR